MPRSNKKTSHGKATPKNGGPREKPQREAAGFSEIWVAGYKSIVDEQRIEIRPLTILAGANSSGKSSIIQPLLLLKQTLEAAYDPGALLLNGPNVKFTSASQLISRAGHRDVNNHFRIGLRVDSKPIVEWSFHRAKDKGFSLERMKFAGNDGFIRTLESAMSNEELIKLATELFKESYDIAKAAAQQCVEGPSEEDLDVVPASSWKPVWDVSRDRCFLELGAKITNAGPERRIAFHSGPLFLTAEMFKSQIRKVIHVPGIRGNSERTYPVTAVSSNFPGLFQNYAASVIAHWQSTGMIYELSGLQDDLKNLGLTWKVSAKSIQDTEVELLVGRLSRQQGEANDMVNIADVGLAMSQVLPVIVALRAASPGQLVFIEQPELHLHPSAQIQLAGVLANAANAGVQVLVETHSSLLLLAIQTLIAEDKLHAEDVKLHWFTRDKEGATRATSANLDERGAFGDWPEDFGTISLEAEHRYLTATEKKLQ
jgi:hypothetical protein